MAQPVANQWSHRLHDSLNQALAQLGASPARKAADLDLDDDELKLYFQDGTERPIQRPKDPEVQEDFYSGKKKRHTVKNNVLVNAKGAIVLLATPCEGKKHDKKIADAAAFTLPFPRLNPPGTWATMCVTPICLATRRFSGVRRVR